MMLMIDGPMITRFIEDTENFNKYADERLRLIDQEQINGGELPKPEAVDNNGDDQITAVDREKFKIELMEMMSAIAQGMGSTPVKVLIDEENNQGSLLMKAYEFEIMRLEKLKLEMEMKKMRIVGENGIHEREINGVVTRDVEILGQKKMKKKRSMKLLSNFCVCSGNDYAENT